MMDSYDDILDNISATLQSESGHPYFSQYLDVIRNGPKKLESLLKEAESRVKTTVKEKSAPPLRPLYEEVEYEKIVAGTRSNSLIMSDSIQPDTQIQLQTLLLEFLKTPKVIFIRSLKRCENLKKLIVRSVELTGECDMSICLPNLTHYIWKDVDVLADLGKKSDVHPMWFFTVDESCHPCHATFWKKGEYLDFESDDFRLKIDKNISYFQCGGISWANRYDIDQAYLNELLSYLNGFPKTFKLKNIFLSFNPVVKPTEILDLELSDVRITRDCLKEVLRNCTALQRLSVANSWRQESLSFTDFESLIELSSLKNVELKYFDIEIEAEPIRWNYLETLHLIGCKLPDNFVSTIAASFPQVRSFQFWGCEFGEEVGMSGKNLEVVMGIQNINSIIIDGSSDNPGFNWGWGIFSIATKHLEVILKNCGAPNNIASARFHRITTDRWRYVPIELP